MPLSTLHTLFEDVQMSAPELVVNKPGWMFAQQVKVWEFPDDPNIPPALGLLVCRSPLVKDTHRMYRPVADLILRAGRCDILDERTIPDKNTMHGQLDCMMFRLAYSDAYGTYDLPEIRARMQRGIDRYVDERVSR
ncbi:hypothetical protein SEA_ACOLYTE_65 [Mycobacterium phage Acolyte]|nr:hypothetical protein SEA_ACOLYTE_65 [Mycobacterium phage Acolyte]